MTFNEVLASVFPALLGSGSLVSLMFYYLKKYIDKRISDEEKAANERAKIRARRLAAENEIRHASGRALFWMYKAIVNPPPDGELEKALQRLQEAEAKNKQLDQEILAKYEKE
jgi:hypothetical protein